MPLILIKLFTENSMGTGVRGDIGETSSGSLGTHVTLASIDGTAVQGTGSNQSMSIGGSAIGAVIGVKMGDSALDANEHVTVNAHGYVYGGGNGVAIEGTGAMLTNHGLIDSQFTGVRIINAAGDATQVINDGTITASNYGLDLTGNGDFKIVNSGTIEAGIHGWIQVTGKMTVTNNGEIYGNVNLGQANDVYNGSKGIVADTANFYGIVKGNDGDDKMIGGKSMDRLEGDLGADRLTGNGGADYFVFQKAEDSTVAAKGRDLITDFHQSQHDQIDVSLIDAFPDDDRHLFVFRGDKNFTGAGGELAYKIHHGDTLVMADIDGDKHADFEIELTGKVHLVSGDFML